MLFGGSLSSRPARVYIYDLPPLWLRRRDFASDNDPIFNTHHVFMSALLRDASALAASPADAALFLAPAFGTNMEGLREFYAHAHVTKRDNQTKNTTRCPPPPVTKHECNNT